MKNLFTLLYTGITTCAFFVCGTNINAQAPIPKSIEHLYSAEKDMRVSDDFNSIEWDTKWTYRKGHGDPSQISIVTDKENPEINYLCLKANANTKKGSGLCTMHSTKYGFYVSRWRVAGIHEHQPSVWHPSIWASCINFGFNERGKERPYQRLELDPMEVYGGTPTWGMHFIPWTGSNSRAYRLKEQTPDFPDYNEWSTIGFEYTPDYIAAWEWIKGKWKFVKSIPFNDERNSNSSVNYRHRQQVYWILSNIYIANKNAKLEDSEFHVDYFYYYPYQYDESMAVDQINYAKIEGKEDEVQVIAKTGGYQGNVEIPAQIIYQGKVYQVTSIASEAFRDCANLTAIRLPKGLKSIGYGAFEKSGIVNKSKEGLVYVNQYLIGFKGELPLEVKVKEGTTLMADGVFGNCRELTAITLPESLKEISYGAFEGCVALQSITFSQSLTHIGRLAFKDCSLLENLTTSKQLTTIGERAFDGCSHLKSITFPGTLKAIGARAFDLCKALESIIMLPSTPPIIQTSFIDTHFPASTVLQVPTGSKAAYQKDGYWKNFTQIHDAQDAIRALKEKKKSEIKKIHDNVFLFEDTHYVGHCDADDKAQYEAAMAAIDAVNSPTITEAKAEIEAAVEAYTEFLAQHTHMPQPGKYYVLESAGYFNDPNIKVYEAFDRPAWKSTRTVDANMLWQFEEQEDHSLVISSANSKKVMGDYTYYINCTMQSPGNGVNFELVKTEQPDVFILVGTCVGEKKGAKSTFTAVKTATSYPKKTDTEGGNIAHKLSLDIKAYPVGWKIRETYAVDIPFKNNQYVTRNYPFPVDLSNIGEAKVFTVSAQTSSAALLKEFKANVLPAATPVVIYSKTPQTLTLPISEKAGTAVTDNFLKGTLPMQNVNGTVYTLITNPSTHTPVFNLLTSSKKTIAANTGYLTSNKSTALAPRSLAIEFEQPTGIEDITKEQKRQQTWYALSGKQVAHAQKGIFVNQDGKVILFK